MLLKQPCFNRKVLGSGLLDVAGLCCLDNVKGNEAGWDLGLEIPRVGVEVGAPGMLGFLIPWFSCRA